MSEISVETVPAGFIPVPTGPGFTDTIQPSYRRIEGDSVSFGLVAAAPR